jgi:DNA-binding CsgD family transcriptional regulator
MGSKSWLILNPHFPQRSAWNDCGEKIPLDESEVAPTWTVESFSKKPATGGQPGGKAVASEVLGPCGNSQADFVIPFSRNGVVFALLGFRESNGSLKDLLVQVPAIRQSFRSWHVGEEMRAETASLRWLLDRSDRSLAISTASGRMLDATPLGREVLKALKFGERHYFRSDRPELPPILVKEISKGATGIQVRLGKRCTARVEEVPLTGNECCPLVAIEFFIEAPVPPPLPLSSLTPVERDVLERMLKGGTTKAIAAERGTSPATVKNQISQILDKTGFDRRGPLLAAARNLPGVG